MEAVQKTPEREAFYKKIEGESLSALWNVMGDIISPFKAAMGGSGRGMRVALTAQQLPEALQRGAAPGRDMRDPIGDADF